MKKFISLLIAVVLLLTTMSAGLSAQAAAADSGSADVMPRYTYTSEHKSTILLNGSTATCESYVSAYSTATKITMKMTLQKKTLFWWSEETSWSTTVNDFYAAMSKTKTLDSGTYRIKMTATVYSGSNSEDITGYSAEVKVS